MSSHGKYQVYYDRIKKIVSKVQDDNDYVNLSKAFAHWYLEKFCDLDEQQIAESIVDDYNDNGIDAIIYNNKHLSLYQFKFPDREKNINKAVDETTALKIISGYRKLTQKRKPRYLNEIFANYRDIALKEEIFSYSFIFVSFTDGLSVHAKDTLESELLDIKEMTGNEIKVDVFNKKRICDLYDKSQKINSIDITLSYIRLDPSYNLENEANSFTGFANAIKVLEACEDSMDVIFDENIRLYEGNVPVNEGIKRTASSEDSKYFDFFHNGVVFICDSSRNSVGNQVINLSAASVVNGCQTIVSLKEVLDEGKLHEDVILPIRIIETTDFDLRAKITEYLNSQSRIKDSYFLANNSFIRELQDGLIKKGYFLERLAHEYSYKVKLKKISEYPKDKILPLEKLVQIYVAFYNNKFAATAKRGKGELFNKNLIDGLIKDISVDAVLTSKYYYDKISVVTSIYRKCRRSKELNSEYINYLGYIFKSQEEFEQIMDSHIFMNTADLLLLNAFSNLKNNIAYKEESDDTLIKKAISVCEQVIAKNPKVLSSAATKMNTTFEQVQAECIK